MPTVAYFGSTLKPTGFFRLGRIADPILSGALTEKHFTYSGKNLLLTKKHTMALKNFEFKARVNDISEKEARLQKLNPRFEGEDHQTDTYFNCERGRLKLREGKIENALIFYSRSDSPVAREAEIVLQKLPASNSIKELLTCSNGILTVVEKKRRIFFIENVKFHFDKLEGLGNFVEVEVIDSDGNQSIADLEKKCNFYREFLDIDKNQIVADSYSDMILKTVD
jgi:adenylate cyclase, class 2